MAPELPASWSRMPIEQIADLGLSNVDKKTVEGQQAVLLCNYMDVYRNDVITADLPFMEATATDSQVESFQLRLDDVMLTKDSEDPSDIAVCSVVVEPLPERVLCGYHLALLRPKEGTDGRFLAFAIRSPEVKGQFVRSCNGSTRFGLTSKTIRGVQVPLPPIPEQRKIAEILGSVDEAIRATEAVIQQTRKVKEGLLQELLTKGIGHTKFKQTEIGEIPVGWEVKTLGDVAEVSNGSTPSRTNPNYWGGSVPWVASGKVNDYIIREPTEYITDEALKKCPLRLIPKGSVVVGMIGQGKTRGMSARLGIDAAINQNLAAVVPRQLLRGGYLHAYLTWSYDGLRGSGRGSNQDAMNCGIVRKFPMALPPVVEQDRILEALDSLDGALARDSDVLTRQQTLKQGLLQDLLTGKVRVKV